VYAGCAEHTGQDRQLYQWGAQLSEYAGAPEYYWMPDYYFKLLDAMQQQQLSDALLIYDDINRRDSRGPCSDGPVGIHPENLLGL